MNVNKHLYSIFAAFVFASLFFVGYSVSAEEPKNESTVEKNKTEILRDIDLFEQSLHETKSCISRAHTEEELDRCRTDETSKRFQKVQDSLSEIGMTREERRLYELRPEK